MKGFNQKPQQDDEDANKSPLLLKIEDMLKRTDPGKWRRTGDELNPNGKYAQPRDTWEKSYSIAIPNGVLVMRNSQPVRSEYYAGGYTITPFGHANYTVEVRAAGWNAQEIVDPGFKSGNNKNAPTSGATKIDVLADGRVAESIYNLVHRTVHSYREQRRREFEQQSVRLLDHLMDRNREMAAEHWDRAEKVEKGGTSTTYSCVIEDVRIEACLKKIDGRDRHTLVFVKDDMTIETKDTTKARDVYEVVIELSSTVRLMALSKVLEGVD